MLARANLQMGEAMSKIALPLSLLGALLILPLLGTPAHALAARTWVSGVGDDVNPCTRVSPCKTFAHAEAQTAAGGEIDVLDPGGFGAVTIVKALTIVNEWAIAGILTPGTNAIVVSAGASDVVTLRGLDINGDGTGLAGILFNSGAALHVQNCLIRNFQGASSGVGIAFEPTGQSQLSVSDTIVTEMGGGVGQGIRVRPTGVGTASVILERVQAINNVTGIAAVATGSAGAGATVNITVRDSVASGNSHIGIVARSIVGGSNTIMMLDRVAATSNGTGIEADGSNQGAGGVVLSNTTVTGNGTGLSSINGGVLASYQNNDVIGNGTDGAPTTTVTPK